MLGKGSGYRSFDKQLVIPGSYFADCQLVAVGVDAQPAVYGGTSPAAAPGESILLPSPG